MSTQTRTRNLAEGRVHTRLDGKWQLEGLLGFGGSAAVYAAIHRNGKRAAIKILHPHCAADEQLRMRFLREGYVANKIGHPGGVSVLDDDTAADGTVYLVMELLEGTSLERLGRGDVPAMSLMETIRVIDALLDVLAHAHHAGVVHRDIKPANLFVTNEGQLKVLDFGIARLAEPSLEGATQTGLMMGTPAFMPPEQARARWGDVDQRSDLWAVGATMLALLLGRRPRVADTANEELLLAMTEPLPAAERLVPGLPREIAHVIDRAVAFNRDDRWPTAKVMQEALRAAAQLVPGGTVLGRSDERQPPASQRTFLANSTVAYNAPSTPPGERTGPPTAPFAPMSGIPSYALDGPSDTTNRAVLRSAGPGARKSVAGRVAIAFGIVTVGLASALGLFLHSRSTRSAPALAATVAPAATASAPLAAEAATELPPAVTDPTPAAVSPAPTISTAPAARGEPRPAARVTRPQPSGSANPAKYFDSRF